MHLDGKGKLHKYLSDLNSTSRRHNYLHFNTKGSILGLGYIGLDTGQKSVK